MSYAPPHIAVVSSGIRRAARIALLALAALVVGGLGLQVPSVIEARRLGPAVRRARSHGMRRWVRPVLRGAPVQGNAAACLSADVEHLYDSLEPAKRDDVSREIEDRVGGPEPLSPDVLGLVRERAPLLDRIDDCGRRTWSWNPDAWMSQDACNLAGLFLLARSSRNRPVECLDLGAAAVRLAQDCEAGNGYATANAARLFQVATLVISDCAQFASEAALEKSAREVGLLAATAPPIGRALEWERVYAARGILGEYGRRIDLRGFFSIRSPKLRAVAELLRRARRDRDVAASGYPAGLGWALRVYGHPPAIPIRSDYDRVLGNDIEASGIALLADAADHALLRATALGLSVLATVRDELPESPPELGAPSYSDPFTGQPMRWRRSPDRRSAVVYSVGPDRRDEGPPFRGHDDVPVLVGPRKAVDSAP